MSPESLAHRLAYSGPPSSGGASKIARVLVEKCGENRLGHVVPDYEITVRSSEVAAGTRCPLSKRAVCVRELAR